MSMRLDAVRNQSNISNRSFVSAPGSSIAIGRAERKVRPIGGLPPLKWSSQKYGILP
jgi:hypothetical protein